MPRSRAEVASLWPSGLASRRVRRRRLARIRQPDAHTIGTACELQSLGHDPAGAVIPAQVAHVRPCRVHGGKSRPCGQRPLVSRQTLGRDRHECIRDDLNPEPVLDDNIKVDLHALAEGSLRLLATDMNNVKEQAMNLSDWQPTIQQMIAECNHVPNESGRSRVLMAWRVKLAQEPHVLHAFQIDRIVRAVRDRLTSDSLQPSSYSPSSPTLAGAASLL